MKPYVRIPILVILSALAAHAQDTSCGIVWYPPIQISPGIPGVDESNPSIAVQGDTVHITWAFTSQKFPYRRSTDGGQSFMPIQELAPDTLVNVAHCFLLSTDSLVYGFWIDFVTIPNKGWMIRSTDRGTTWGVPRMIRDSTDFWHFGAAMHDTIVLGIIRRVGENRRVFRSTNGGDTWTESTTFIIGNDPRVAMTPGNLHRITGWIFDSAGVWSEFVVQYRKSTDLGETWSDSVNLSTMSTRAYEPSIAADGSGDSATVLTAWKDSKYGCLTLVGCSILGRFSNSTGSGFHPEMRFDTRPAGVVATTAVYGNVMAVGWNDDMPDGGIRLRVSFDGGGTWCPPFNVRDSGDIRGIALTENTIHVVYNELIGGSMGDWRVFYRRGVILPTSVPDNPLSPPPFARLMQNYPNPFNPTTTLSFVIDHSSFVMLKVYSLLGQEVATLVNEKKDAGEYTVEWNAEGLPSGVYFYRLFAGGHVETKKAILLK